MSGRLRVLDLMLTLFADRCVEQQCLGCKQEESGQAVSQVSGSAATHGETRTFKYCQCAILRGCMGRNMVNCKND